MRAQQALFRDDSLFLSPRGFDSYDLVQPCATLGGLPSRTVAAGTCMFLCTAEPLSSRLTGLALITNEEIGHVHLRLALFR